jgi:hypothetical protein
MNKQMILVAVAAGAVASAFVPAAQAKGGHRHFHGFHWTPSFSSSYEEPVIVRRRVIQKVYVEKKKVVASEPAAKLIDGKGRQYDAAAKVWFDGKGQCWSGKEAFAFRSGNWFYGNARWYEIDGSWKTNAAEAPATIDCEASPMIAAKLQGKAKPKDDTSAKDVGQNLDKAEPKKTTTTETAPPVKVATETAASTPETPKASECKKYFPSVGEMLTVPCGQ